MPYCHQMLISRIGRKVSFKLFDWYINKLFWYFHHFKVVLKKSKVYGVFLQTDWNTEYLYLCLLNYLPVVLRNASAPCLSGAAACGLKMSLLLFSLALFCLPCCWRKGNNIAIRKIALSCKTLWACLGHYIINTISFVN